MRLFAPGANGPALSHEFRERTEVLVSERLQFPTSWQSPAMPGYGTFPAPFAGSTLTYVQTARSAQKHIEQALSAGYRHIDTAFTYRNQDLVGAAVRALGILRQDVFVTSKLHPNNNTYDDALLKVQEAIRLIWAEAPGRGDHYLDAFLIHYPGLRDPLAAWRGLLQARSQGWVKHAGVSNFEIGHLQKLREMSGQYPELNQIEFHPYLYPEQRVLLEFCKAKGIVVEGYSPLAEGEVLKDPDLGMIAQRHQTTCARVALKWCMQHGVRPIVGTRNFAHLKANAAPYDFALSRSEMAQLDSIGCRKTTRVSLKWGWDPQTAPLGASKLRSSASTLMRCLGRVLRPS